MLILDLHHNLFQEHYVETQKSQAIIYPFQYMKPL
jgi:hypothetical protein